MKLYCLSILTLILYSLPLLSQNIAPAKECEVTLAGYSGDIGLTKTQIKKAGNKLKLLGCSDSAKIIKFVMILTTPDGHNHTCNSISSLFTAEMKGYISQMRKDGHIIIQNVTIKPLDSNSYIIIPGINIQITGD
jgi:hypothetical protein